MAWAVFTTKAQWTTFHDAACADLGVPRPGKNALTGEVALSAQWTDAAFEPLIVDVVVNGNPRKVGLCRVPQLAVTRYSLNTLTDPTRNDDGTWNVTYNGNTYTVQLASDETIFPFRKPKPAQWTDPDTGITYTT